MLGGSQATSGTVDLLSAAPSVSHLTFDANKTITITSTAAGGGRLTLDNGGNPAAVVVSGSGHAIDAKVAVMLDSDAWITTSGSGDSLSIAGDISNGTAAHGIVKDGLGTLILSGSDTYTGGTSVVAGTLILASERRSSRRHEPDRRRRRHVDLRFRQRPWPRQPAGSRLRLRPALHRQSCRSPERRYCS